MVIFYLMQTALFYITEHTFINNNSDPSIISISNSPHFHLLSFPPPSSLQSHQYLRSIDPTTFSLSIPIPIRCTFLLPSLNPVIC